MKKLPRRALPSAKVNAEYQAGLIGYVQGDGALWKALAGKLMEKQMYERRLKAAQARK